MKHNFIKDAASFQIFIKFIHEYFLLFKRATKKEGKSSKKNSISKHFYRINNKIRNLGRLSSSRYTNMFVDCFVFCSHFTLEFTQIRVPRHDSMATRRRGDTIAAVRVAIGKNRKLPSVSRGCNEEEERMPSWDYVIDNDIHVTAVNYSSSGPIFHTRFGKCGW